MSDEQLYSAEEAAAYNFSEAPPPPADFDPDQQAMEDMPAGWHLVTVKGFQVALDKEFRWKGETHVLNQLRPQLAIVQGQPHAGATTLAFLPMPSPGRPMPAGLANQWGNFLKSLGFPVSPQSYVPQGFKITDIIGKRCYVSIETQCDGNGNPKLKPNGEVRTGPKLFGYKPESSGAEIPKSAPQQAAAQAFPPTPPGAPTASAPAGFDI